MSEITLIDCRKIAIPFAIAIDYGDITGLTCAEDALLDDWISQFGKNDYPVINIDDTRWAKCDVTGLEGDCVTVSIYRNQ